MKKRKFSFNQASVDYYLGGSISQLKEIADPRHTVLVTDENIYTRHAKRFKPWNTIVLKPGEAYKVQATADEIITQLIEMEADRKTTLVGVGGGVITDLTGYVASIYMRGIPFGFVPTSLLAMVDASIGGKNGIDVGVYKNLAGTVRQPSFILYDMSFLNSLPEKEWRNGFAEIIKHASIRDASMFAELEKNSLAFYRRRRADTDMLVRRNALLKTKVVQGDEFEEGDRKLLNFGHTLGHALENQYELSHGEAISIGMVYASSLSENLLGFKDKERVVGLLQKYGLPVRAEFDKDLVMKVLKMDKKRQRESISFILLKRIGKAVIQPISIEEIYRSL
ncbi:MAG TPA: 3-dehydroquinate synthase [Flavisolibacter sp.]|nr:3-dehydroquinate synthase [Flavisolibacter sp.]